MTEPNENIMARINKLLLLAADEGASPHERELAEERAEKLMAQHVIDEHEARQAAERGGNRVRTPVTES